ncbi:MAG: deoxyribose-phosphate aldolase [Saprospiraceae bacterium]
MDDLNSIAQRIDHTALRADLTKDDIFEHCQSAIKYRFKTVCIPPYFVKYAKELIFESQTGVCSIIGFPLGYNGISSKTEETKTLLDQGCDEIDFVINIAAVKSGDWKTIDDEMDRLVTVVHLKNKVVKAILETCMLTTEEIEILCNKAVEHNVDFVKTSTGFANKGAELEIVKLMKKTVKNKILIKASGGIKTRAQALDYLAAGADRLGTSSGIKIVTG